MKFKSLLATLFFFGLTASAGLNSPQLPSQSGNAGKVLTTDGSILSWGAGGGGGSVSSVALALPVSVFSVSGSPVTTSGTLTGAFTTQTANTVFSGPTSGGAATPTFRALVAADIPATLAATAFSGAVTIQSGNVLQLNGATSGNVQVKSPAAPTSWLLTLPTTAGTNTQMLTTNGSGVTTWTDQPTAGTTPTKQLFTTPGSFTYTTPANSKLLKVVVLGGGAGGGGSAGNAVGTGSAGGGGSGGATSIIWISCPCSATYPLVVGGGGAGGAAGNNNGGDGSDSIFNTTVIGGHGIHGDGGAQQTGAIDAVSKNGGTASGGDLNISGGVGGPGLVFSAAAFTATQAFSGAGGTSSLGGGGAAVYTAGDGGAGGLYGSGGGGGANAFQYNTNAQAGGDGAKGLVLVEEFY